MLKGIVLCFVLFFYVCHYLCFLTYFDELPYVKSCFNKFF